ncbi:MAG: DUF4062 domain-containing protein [Chloroflexota bacterium]
MSGKVFISYRKKDYPDFVARIRDHFSTKFDTVFMDIYDIPAASDWKKSLEEEILKSDAVLVIIGPDWIKLLREKAATFQEDIVRFEIELAIENNKIIAPICVKGAIPPKKDEIPKSLIKLLDYHIITLPSDRTFQIECTHLANNIHKEITKRDKSSNTNSSKKKSTKTKQLTVSFDVDINVVDQNALISLIARLAEVGVGDVIIRDMRSGSTIVTFELPENAARKLENIILNQPELFEEMGFTAPQLLASEQEKVSSIRVQPRYTTRKQLMLAGGKPRIDVMISSTSRDLPQHRQVVQDAALRLGMFPVAMEHLGAMPHADAISASLEMVDICEIYVGIFGMRYGYVPDDERNPEKISITEMVYRVPLPDGIPSP